MKDLTLLEKKIKRLKKSQEEAERLLEEKSRELYVINQNLESEVKRRVKEFELRTKEFEEARDQAIKANQAKSQFLANMSHEIRTPLNGMIGLLDLLKKSPLNNDQQEHVSIVEQSSKLLLTIINEILEFSKIEAGKLEIEYRDFNIKKCIEDIVGVLSNEIYKKGLELPIYIDEKIPDRVKSDEARIRQILLNLIGNAMKFTPEGEISISLLLKDDSHLLFEVEDTGIGIPNNKLETIFQSFSQADISDTRKYGGTGLGLTISKKIVEAMNGKIWVESEEAKGSCFSFTIPLEEATGLEKVEKINLGQEKKMHLLIKNKKIRENLNRRFESWGCSVLIAHSIEALEENIRKSSQGDGLVVDSLFFSVEKSDILSNIKEICKEKLLSFIVATSPANKSSIGTTLQFSEAHILAKPIKRDELYQAVLNKPFCKEETQKKESDRLVKNSSEIRLLLVEDNLINQQVAIAMLASGGYRCQIANNGQEAVNFVKENDYDLILMDCQMPVMDGFSATQAIRQMEEESKRHIPIVAMTANAFRKTKEQCFDAGMDAFVTKPVTAKELIATIEERLNIAS